jgi:hypothetical protein
LSCDKRDGGGEASFFGFGNAIGNVVLVLQLGVS